MRIECLFRSAVGRSEKCVEDSGGVQPRQENSAECGTKSQHRLNSSGLRTRTALGLRLWNVLAYAFPMRYVLGFDGGGTKTDCVLMDETGTILARSRSGSSNPTTFGLEAALAALTVAATEALRAVGKSEKDVGYFLAGFSGAAEPSMQWAIKSGLQPKFPNARISVTSDLLLSLGATGEIPSVVVIAGTGSAVLGRNAPVEVARAGGFGPVIGDPGSAYDIGRKAVAMSFQKHLNSEAFPLGGKILETFQCKFDELLDRARSRPGDIFPKIFPMVATAAEAGDVAARVLLTSAAQDLRDQAREVIEKLQLRGSSFFLAKTGGVFDGSAFLNAQFDSMIREVAPRVRIGPLPRSVADAAAQLAREALTHPLVLNES